MVVGAGNDHLACFERLAERIKRRFGEFRQLVQKQHPAMCQRNLARPRPRATANQRRHGCRMMRVTEWPTLHQPTGGERAGDGMQHRHIQRLARCQGRQRPGSRAASIDCRRRAARPSTGYAPPRRRSPAPGAPFPDHEGRPCPERRHVAAKPAWHRQTLPASKVVQQRHQIGRRDDGQVGGPGGFRPTSLRTDQVQIGGNSRHCGRQHPGTGSMAP